MRVGLAGGTFDPIHLGHLIIAEEARVRLGLDEVVFIPAGQPWMKADRSLTPPRHRLNMVRLATASNPFFCVSSIEIDRSGPTYTVDTIRELGRESVGGHDLYFILGIDSLRGFHRWKEPEAILELCTLVTAPRPGYQDNDFAPPVNIPPEKLVSLEGPGVEISSTEIRWRVALGLSVRYWVPEEVERYIHQYSLYRDRGSVDKPVQTR
jgi:nicotinate-nucleotide adenylyltransferase